MSKKSSYIIITILCSSYFLLCYLFKLFVYSDGTIISSGEFIYYLSFPFFSIAMGVLVIYATRTIILPTILWFFYSGILEIVLTENTNYTKIFVLFFLVPACITKGIIALRAKHSSFSKQENASEEELQDKPEK